MGYPIAETARAAYGELRGAADAEGGPSGGSPSSNRLLSDLTYGDASITAAELHSVPNVGQRAL